MPAKRASEDFFKREQSFGRASYDLVLSFEKNRSQKQGPKNQKRAPKGRVAFKKLPNPQKSYYRQFRWLQKL